MPKIYLAASYIEKARMKGVRDFLVEQGYVVTSRWIDSPDTGLDSDMIAGQPEQAAARAQHDLSDLLISDIIVVFTQTPSTTGGYHVELGLAMGLQKRIAIVGPRMNIFHTFPWCQWHPSFTDFAQFVRSINAASEAWSEARPYVPASVS